MITKEELDALAAKYETKDFIKDDPIQFLHRFNDKGKEDAELAGFIASLLHMVIAKYLFQSSMIYSPELIMILQIM